MPLGLINFVWCEAVESQAYAQLWIMQTTRVVFKYLLAYFGLVLEPFLSMTGGISLSV